MRTIAAKQATKLDSIESRTSCHKTQSGGSLATCVIMNKTFEIGYMVEM